MYAGIDNVSEWVLSRVLRSQAETLGSREAIRFIDGENWSYTDCLNEGQKLANILADHGVSRGSNVVVMVEDPADFCRLWFGLSLIGAVMVAINTALKGQVLAHQLNCNPALVAVDGNALGVVTEALKDLESSPPILCTDREKTNSEFPVNVWLGDALADTPDSEFPGNQNIRSSDTACIMYTSGTSGPSKGVLMPEAHCFMFAVGTIENQQLGPEDTFYICLPLFHANGLFMQLYPALVMGAKAIVRGRFSASNWLNDIRQSGATHTNLLGATAAFVVAQSPTEFDKDHRLRVIGSAPLPEEPERIFRERFGVADVLPLYGMTEVNIPLYGQVGESAPGTCGKVYDRWFEVEIRDPQTDLPVPDGEIGEIMVRPKHPFCFMSGYAAMPDKTVEAWRNFWFHTGDAGKRRDDGYFIFIDRIKDSIRRRGENISSYEVEQALLDIDGITEVAAYGVPAGGEGMEDEVMVAIMATPGHDLDPSEIHKIASQRLPYFAVPSYIRIVDDLPKTPTGKVQKVKLREQGVTENCWEPPG